MPKKKTEPTPTAMPEPKPIRRQAPTFHRVPADHLSAFHCGPKLTLDFGLQCYADGGLPAVDQLVGITMPIGFAKAVVACIQGQIGQYEGEFGPVPTD